MKQINHTFEDYPTLKIIVFILAIVGIAFFSTEYAYAIEILATPEKETFGPNDSFLIFLEIVDYIGGDVQWMRTNQTVLQIQELFQVLKPVKKVT